MNRLMDVEGGLLAEPLRANVTLKGLFACTEEKREISWTATRLIFHFLNLTCVRPVVDVQVGFSGEFCGTLLTDVWLQLD